MKKRIDSTGLALCACLTIGCEPTGGLSAGDGSLSCGTDGGLLHAPVPAGLEVVFVGVDSAKDLGLTARGLSPNLHYVEDRGHKVLPRATCAAAPLAFIGGPDGKGQLILRASGSDWSGVFRG